MMRMLAFRAAGIACFCSWVLAEWPGPGPRPNAGDKKKFCMSIITRAVLAGSRIMGDVLVVSARRGVTGGEEGCNGWVRSKALVREEWSQKLSGLPITARRWVEGFSVILLVLLLSMS